MWITNLKVGLVAAVVLAFYTTVAWVIPQLPSEVPEALSLGAAATPEALVAAGEKIYNGAGGCTACHGLGTRAPNLLTDDRGAGTIGTRCGTREPGKDCKTYLHESMVNPSAFVVPGFGPIMPDMRRQLSEDQIWATVAFLQSQGGEVTVTAADIPPTPAAGATPAAAGQTLSTTTDPVALLRENACLGCHKLGAEGTTLAPPFDGMGARLRRDYIRESILDPNAKVAQGYDQFKGMMPAFFGDKLSAGQLESLVNFLSSQK